MSLHIISFFASNLFGSAHPAGRRIIFCEAGSIARRCCQYDAERLDWLRTLRFAACGGLITGPCYHYWFLFLSRTFPRADARSALTRAVLLLRLNPLCFIWEALWLTVDDRRE